MKQLFLVLAVLAVLFLAVPSDAQAHHGRGFVGVGVGGCNSGLVGVNVGVPLGVANYGFVGNAGFVGANVNVGVGVPRRVSVFRGPFRTVQRVRF